MEGDNYGYNRENDDLNTPNNNSNMEYDGHSNHIQLPSYASSPASSPQTPFSPRAMAIQQLKRAASLREQKGNQSSNSSSQHPQHNNDTTPPAPAAAAPSPSIGMSPSMSRAPSIKRLGLERSASDAARRMAMAKLTGEKISPPPEFTMPKTPLPAGPLPSLADLQARHEHRLGLASPEPVASTSTSTTGSPPHPLSRNPSSASTALSRQLSAASNRTGASNLSRNPSFATGSNNLNMSASSDLGHGSQESTTGSAEDDESKQRRTDERQEARSNLIRKLSRGRLAGAAAAANIRERHANNNNNNDAMPVDSSGEVSNSLNTPASPPGGLQRRPSLADVLARAESRNQQRTQTPEPMPPKASTSSSQQQHSRQLSQQSNASPLYTPTTSHSYTSNGMASSIGENPFSLQSELLSPPTALPSAAFSPPSVNNARMNNNSIYSPGTPASMTSPASSLRKAANLQQYGHIPIPPTPASASTSTSHSNSHSNTFSPSSANGGNGPSSGHESIYSAVSNYRSYRHTMERDRDSAMARMQMEDNFELENAAALEEARTSVATSAFTGANNNARLGGGGSRTRLHEHHPLSDDEREEELEEEHGRNVAQNNMQEEATLRQQDFTPDHSDAPQQAQMALRFSPPDSLAESRQANRHNLPTQQHLHQHQQRGNDYLTATPPSNNRKLSDSTSVSSHSARNRAAGSMPQTPLSHSPVSPFAFSPAISPVVAGHEQQGADTSQGIVPLALVEQNEQEEPFLRHHQKEANGDFPVSVVRSRASHYPDYTTLPVAEQPPMPADMQSIMKNHDAPAMLLDHNSNPPPVPEKMASPPSSDKRAHWDFGENRDATASPTPEHRKPFRIPEPEQDDNAGGPTSEYRFPTASSRGRRPDSISSSNDHHDDGLNSMISQLEAMQAASPETQPISGSSSSPIRPFGARGLEGGKKMLARPHPQQIFPQASPPTYHKQLPRQGTPEGKAFPINGLASQLRQPALQARAIGSPKLAERSLPTPDALNAQTRKVEAVTNEQINVVQRRHAAANAAQPVRESSNETFVFSGDAPAYHSGASAENDSAPSLARTGTGSSSSGFSTHSDGGLAVIADVLPPTQTKEQVMSRLSQLLSAYRNQPKKPSALEDPPRQLLLHSPVLQVVNSNTVKDRYLFLFNDILVIAKPIIDEDAGGDPILPGLDSKFVVKSIVELSKLKLTAQTADTGEDPVQKRKHPLLLTFVDRFANDPRKAVSALVAKAGLSNDATTIANLLFRNPELNRSQLGAYLAHKDQKPVLKAYCDRFRLAGIRIEDALRVFIGSLRLPNDYTAAEYMLSVFASQWLSSNPGTGMTNDGVFATKLVLSMMELNDALHSGIDDEATAAGNLFSFPNSAITVDDFIAAFRLKDPHGALPDEHLTRIYLSIRKDRLQQAADNAIISGIPEIQVVTHPSRLPNRLTYRTASENISLTIPKVDPKFAIKLVGQDLRFEPPVLTFARSKTATFRVTPTALGSKAMLFIRLGPNAHLYRNLPINKTFSVERAFMNHTFQIAFVNHLGVKRKYLFSLSNAEMKYSWVDTLRSKIENSPIEQPNTPRPARLSDAVSLQVLRDALITPDEPAPVLANKLPLHGGRSGFNTPPNSRGRSAAGGAGSLQRSSSFSKTYAHGLGKAESDLAEQRRPSVTNTSFLAPLTMRRGSKDDEKTVQHQQQQQYKTGQEIVTAVRQNSLLPLVLGFVGAGVEGVDALPRKPIYQQSSQVQTTPAQSRGSGRFKDL